jgi:hypothetical protein
MTSLKLLSTYGLLNKTPPRLIPCNLIFPLHVPRASYHTIASMQKTTPQPMAMVAATTSLAPAAPSLTRKVGGHVLSGNGHFCLTLAQRRRSASTIFSRDPPAKVEHALIPVDPLQSHNLSLIVFQQSPQALKPNVDCPRKLLLRHEP